MQPDRIADLELLLGHHFRDKSFIENALSHSSVKTAERPSNERLEFLGDSVLGLIVAEALYRRFPDDDEGTLTRIKSQAVSRATLQRIAVAMGLDRYIFVGKGVAKREIPASLLGNLFEAIVGAIYLDSGLASARKFILRHLDVVFNEIVEDRAEKNYKSALQHYCQRDLGAVPIYKVLRESGPAHGRAFEVGAVIGGKEYGRAKAASKKEAEQGAARAALIHFRQVDEDAAEARRGAGTVLRVGIDGAGKSKKRRKKRRKGGEGSAAAAPAPQAEEARPRRRRGKGGESSAAKADAQTDDARPGRSREGEGSRRRGRRGGRGRRKAREKAEAQANNAPSEARPAEPRPALPEPAPTPAPVEQRPEAQSKQPVKKKAPRKKAPAKKAAKKKVAKKAAKKAPAKKAAKKKPAKKRAVRKKKTSPARPPAESGEAQQ
ncbi:MAG: ribonuclease III [Planctomycetota bacterium]|jgi:ribonuclease-3